MRRIILCLFVIAFTAQAATAQNAPASLSILIETPNAQTVGCGVTKDSQLSAIRSALRYNRIQERPQATVDGARVYVFSTGGNAAGNCVISVRVSVESFQIGKVEGMGKVSGYLEYCGKSSTLVGGNMSQRVSNEVKDLFEKCISDMQDNIII